MACLGPCPLGKEGEKVTWPKGKFPCPGRPDGVFFEPGFYEFLPQKLSCEDLLIEVIKL